jgi:branched-chain amino acid transport system permease protein
VKTAVTIALTVGGLVLLAVPLAVMSDYSLGVLTLVTAFAVASLAQNLLSGYADIPSLGNVAFFATSAYTAAGLISLARLPVAVSLLIGIAAAGALGFLVGLPALRISGMHLAIVTVALVFVCQELMTQFGAYHVEASSGITVSTPDWLLSARGLYIAAVCVALVCYVLIWNLLRSRTGRAIVALSDNPHAAAAAGIDATSHRLLAFVLSGMVTGLAGCIYLYYAQTVAPGAFPLDLSVAFLTMMILGGSRSIGGSVLGALIIGLLPQFLKLFPAQIGTIDVQNSVYGLYALLLLVTLRYFPDGVWSVLVRATDRIRVDGSQASDPPAAASQ